MEYITEGNFSKLHNTSGIGNGSYVTQSYENLRRDTYECMTFKFAVNTIAVGIMCIFGFLGNIMSFLVLKRDRSTLVASLLLQSLAIADNALLVFWTVHYSIRYLLHYLHSPDHNFHPAWIYIRVYTFPLLYMAQMETIWLTVLIALNRFLAVCMPYKAPQLCTVPNVYKEVAAVTICSIIYNIPRFLELKTTPDENGTTSWKRTAIGSNPTFKTVYLDVMYYLVSFICPLLFLAVVNTKVTIAYQAAKKRKRQMTLKRNEGDNNITLVMIIVVLVFMLCQAPARIVQIVWGYNYDHCHQHQFYFIHVSNILEVLNSSINFLIYFIFRKRFRDIFWDSFCLRPLVSRHRNSTRATTTEGLSLVAFGQTTTKEGSNQTSGGSQKQSRDNEGDELDNTKADSELLEHTETEVESHSNHISHIDTETEMPSSDVGDSYTVEV